MVDTSSKPAQVPKDLPTGGSQRLWFPTEPPPPFLPLPLQNSVSVMSLILHSVATLKSFSAYYVSKTGSAYAWTWFCLPNLRGWVLLASSSGGQGQGWPCTCPPVQRQPVLWGIIQGGLVLWHWTVVSNGFTVWDICHLRLSCVLVTSLQIDAPAVFLQGQGGIKASSGGRVLWHGPLGSFLVHLGTGLSRGNEGPHSAFRGHHWPHLLPGHGMGLNQLYWDALPIW